MYPSISSRLKRAPSWPTHCIGPCGILDVSLSILSICRIYLSTIYHLPIVTYSIQSPILSEACRSRLYPSCRLYPSHLGSVDHLSMFIYPQSISMNQSISIHPLSLTIIYLSTIHISISYLYLSIYGPPI